MAEAVNWRRAFKTVVASACSVPAAIALPRIQPYIVGYHRVAEDFASTARTTIPALVVSTRMFEQQLDWIGRRFHFVTLDEIGERLQDDAPFDRPVAAVTFDDGYRDVYEQACPILLRKGIPAAFFVVSDLVGVSAWQVFDRLYRNLKHAFPVWQRAAADAQVAFAGSSLSGAVDRIAQAPGPEAAAGALLSGLSQASVMEVVDTLESRFGPLRELPPALMTWEDIADLKRRGFSIGSHTRTHTWLPRECADRVASELTVSRSEIERHVGDAVQHFAYPAGEFNRDVTAAVSAAGYRFAYTICAHRDAAFPSLTIPRELLWEHTATDGHGRFSPVQMSCHIRGVFSAMNGCAQRH